MWEMRGDRSELMSGNNERLNEALVDVLRSGLVCLLFSMMGEGIATTRGL